MCFVTARRKQHCKLEIVTKQKRNIRNVHNTLHSLHWLLQARRPQTLHRDRSMPDKNLQTHKRINCEDVWSMLWLFGMHGSRSRVPGKRKYDATVNIKIELIVGNVTNFDRGGMSGFEIWHLTRRASGFENRHKRRWMSDVRTHHMRKTMSALGRDISYLKPRKGRLELGS